MLSIVLLSLLCLSLLIYAVAFYDNGYGGFVESPLDASPDVEHEEGIRRTVRFPAVDGTLLEGWLFLPRGARGPLVLMAPGLTGTKDAYLETFAWSFVRRGLAVLALDYRGFGGSAGRPRHWVSPSRHREDYEAAVAFARGPLAAEVDAERLGLWGSSFSGGTVLTLAAQRPELARAVVAQAPYLETPPSQQPSRAEMARYVAWTSLDLLRAHLGEWLRVALPPVYVPVFGRPGELVFAKSCENPTLAGDEGGSRFWQEMSPPRGGWENKMLARLLAELDTFVPMQQLDCIRCPVMLVSARHDDLVPHAILERGRQRLAHPQSELYEIDCRHFGLYVDPVVGPNAARQADFLHRHLS